MTERHGDREATPETEPAPTLTGRARSAEWVYRNGNQANACERAASELAPTVHFGAAMNDVRWTTDPLGLKGPDWPTRRPATTIAGDARVFQPGGHHGKGEQSANAVRVTVEEAAALQTFPPDYPWQGSRTKQFEQVGNAVPPMLAEAVLRALIGGEA